jgi:DNA topoisomerase-3
MKALHVAEKPSVARQAAAVLGHGRAERKCSCSPYHPNWFWSGVFEFSAKDGTRFVVDEQVFTSVSGHVEELDFVTPYHKWSACEPVDIFRRDLVQTRRFVPERNAKVAQNLGQLARTCQYLVLWLDGDSEGEAISDEVQRICKLPPSMVFRARFSAVTPRDLFRACATLDRVNAKVVEAVWIRQEIDLRAGAAFTRWLTRHIQRHYPQALICTSAIVASRRKGASGTSNLGRNERLQGSGVSSADAAVVSYGPCQFPTLGLVVDRYRERREFQTKPFWTIRMRIQTTGDRASGNQVELCWDRARIFDRFIAYVLFQRLHDAVRLPGALRMIACEKQPAHRSRPLPLSTVELQKEASRKLKLSSAQTMEIAEQLYQQGYISYPRTETDRFPTDDRGISNLKALITLQSEDQRWSLLAKRLLETDDVSRGGFKAPRAGSHDDHAHPPIHPTSAAPPGTLSGDAARLYEYIARRFLASCSADASGERTIWRFAVFSGASEARTEAPQETCMFPANTVLETFTSKGLRITNLGYLEVFSPYEKWLESTLPGDLECGAAAPEHFWLTELRLEESITEPPALLSEADLIAAMDRHGIGTDATIAEHIKKIQERHYVVKQIIAEERRRQSHRAGTQVHDAAANSSDECDASQVTSRAHSATRTRKRCGLVSRSSVQRFVPMKLGQALVEAFESCHVHLARPNLRAEQERRQKLVAKGEASGSEALDELLTSFAEAFRRLVLERSKFDATFCKFFPKAEPPSLLRAPAALELTQSSVRRSCVVPTDESNANE